MAAVYEAPPVQKHGAGRNRGFSHARKTATQIDPSQFAARNGAIAMNGGGISSATPKPYEAHHHSTSSTDTIKAVQQDHSHTLPIPPSFSTPTMERSKSWDRRKSVGLPARLSLDHTGYGLPLTNERQRDITDPPAVPLKKSMAREVLGSIVIQLPFTLASLIFGFGFSLRVSPTNDAFAELAGSILGRAKKPQDTSVYQSTHLELVCGITALTLLLVGTKGSLMHSRVRKEDTMLEEAAKENTKSYSMTWIATKAFARILSVALPLYATSVLGVRAPLIILASVLSNTSAPDRASEASTWKGIVQLLKQSRSMLATSMLSAIFDLTGLTSSLSRISILAGYLALGSSTTVLPLPFPSSNPRSSILALNAPISLHSRSISSSNSWEESSKVQGRAGLPLKRSSVLETTTREAQLTLVCGAFLGVATLIIFYFSGSSAGGLTSTGFVGLTLSALAAAFSFTTSDLSSVDGTSGLGFLASSILGGFVIAFTYGEWAYFAFHSVLSIFFLTAVKVDTHLNTPHSHSDHSHHHHHGHAKAHLKEHGNVSRFTEAILVRLHDWPLLYSIIAEKDSRRIFYFMW